MKKLVIIFPGIGYHCDKPLLYYGRAVARECGYEECTALAYSYDGRGIRGDEQKMRLAFEALYAQAEERLKDVDFGKYEDILFMSKSVGTIIASAYAKKHGINCRHVLYTPLAQTFSFAPERGISFIGTKDPWSNVDEVLSLSRKNGTPIHVYEGANHSLEAGDCMGDLEVLKDVMGKTEDFLLAGRK